MKIKFDIDITPQELRTFLGLPDVEPLQQEMMEKLRENMAKGMEMYDPAKLLQPLLPEHLRNFEALQKGFWEAFLKKAPTGDSDPGGTKP
jgi:hypothetical protein